MNQIIKSVFIFFINTTFCCLLSGQLDHELWSSIQVQSKINDEYTLNFKPILRLNEDVSEYQNVSIDIFLKKKLSTHWSIQALSRTWFVPSIGIRQFLWFDLGYSNTISVFDWSTRGRIHGAFDVAGRYDPDFFRWSTRLSKNLGILTPYMNIEPWWSLNSFFDFERIRYEPGVRISLGKTEILDLQYRIQRDIDELSLGNVDMYVVNLVFKI